MNSKYVAIVAVAAIVVAGCAAFLVLKDNGDDGHSSIVGTVIGEDSFPNTDSRLWVYGNANEDDKIDNDDIIYLEGIIEGKNARTQLADANADGKVDSEDVEYLKRIISKEEIDVYYIDNYFKVAKVSWPVNSVAIGYCSGAYVADVTGVCDKVTMVDGTIAKYWKGMNPKFESAVSFGDTSTPDYEEMMKQKIDVYVPGYADANADPLSPDKLNPVGIDVMFMSTADNSGIDYPNEYIDRSIVMFGYLLQGDMDKVYNYLAWHDEVLGKLKEAGASIAEGDKAAFMMARSSPFYKTDGTVSITGYNNTNNIHAVWVGIDAVGQHSNVLKKNYNTLTQEQVLAVINEERNANTNMLYYMDNAHDGIRGQYDLTNCVNADAEMLKSSTAKIHYMGMAREAGNSPLYVIELIFYQNVMYPELTATTGLKWDEQFEYYLDNFTSYDYSDLVDKDKFFHDFGVIEA